MWWTRSRYVHVLFHIVKYINITPLEIYFFIFFWSCYVSWLGKPQARDFFFKSIATIRVYFTIVSGKTWQWRSVSWYQIQTSIRPKNKTKKRFIWWWTENTTYEPSTELICKRTLVWVTQNQSCDDWHWPKLIQRSPLMHCTVRLQVSVDRLQASVVRLQVRL